MSNQLCRMQWNDSFDKVECCFDIVAGDDETLLLLSFIVVVVFFSLATMLIGE